MSTKLAEDGLLSVIGRLEELVTRVEVELDGTELIEGKIQAYAEKAKPLPLEGAVKMATEHLQKMTSRMDKIYGRASLLRELMR